MESSPDVGCHADLVIAELRGVFLPFEVAEDGGYVLVDGVARPARRAVGARSLSAA